MEDRNRFPGLLVGWVQRWQSDKANLKKGGVSKHLEGGHLNDHTLSTLDVEIVE